MKQADTSEEVFFFNFTKKESAMYQWVVIVLTSDGEIKECRGFEKKKSALSFASEQFEDGVFESAKEQLLDSGRYPISPTSTVYLNSIK